LRLGRRIFGVLTDGHHGKEEQRHETAHVRYFIRSGFQR
jgi:hypothetical protein